MTIRILRAGGIVAAFWLLVPDAAFALLFGFTQVGLLSGGMDVVYPDAARAFGGGRLLFFAAAVFCILGMERRRRFFAEEKSAMPALYDFPKKAAGGLSVAGVFAYALGMMLHFFEAWSVSALFFAVVFGSVLSFHVLGAMMSDGTDGAEVAAVDALDSGGA